MHWASHVPRKKPGSETQDYKKLNKMAAQSNVATTSQLKSFKSNQDVRLMPPGAKGSAPNVIPSDVIPSFAYGRKSRPSTPINSVVGNQFGTEHEDVLAFQYNQHEQQRDMPNGRRVIKLTKAAKAQISNARSDRAIRESDSPPKEPFKMTKFKNVQSKLSQSVGMSKSVSLPCI